MYSVTPQHWVDNICWLFKCRNQSEFKLRPAPLISSVSHYRVWTNWISGCRLWGKPAATILTLWAATTQGFTKGIVGAAATRRTKQVLQDSGTTACLSLEPHFTLSLNSASPTIVLKIVNYLGYLLVYFDKESVLTCFYVQTQGVTKPSMGWHCRSGTTPLIQIWNPSSSTNTSLESGRQWGDSLITDCGMKQIEMLMRLSCHFAYSVYVLTFVQGQTPGDEATEWWWL